MPLACACSTSCRVVRTLAQPAFGLTAHNLLLPSSAHLRLLGWTALLLVPGARSQQLAAPALVLPCPGDCRRPAGQPRGLRVTLSALCLQAWRGAMPRVMPFYAVKCYPEPGLLKLLIALGTGFDCASKGECEMMLKMGAWRAAAACYLCACCIPAHLLECLAECLWLVRTRCCPALSARYRCLRDTCHAAC